MVDTNTLFQLLANDIRRRILYALCDNASIHVPEGILSHDQVQSQDTQPHSPHSSSSQINGESVQQLEMQLHHMHLPKLEEEGIIEWERETQTVSRGPQFDKLEPVLRLLFVNQNRLPDDFL
ncbi:hypothetical protein [Haloarcula sp. JP-L23]|uniref:DUF7344 domain-containing protein n=1 Tax=Haloarcula sp. JP-L23 TaxID=2716717 RepID=UPI00140EFF5E|nr:hypothetical protein G9465_18415 [Haloarcula sp. JP-L23]